MKLPKVLKIKNPNFSKEAVKLIENHFPKRDTPYTNLKVDVLINPSNFKNEKDFTQEVHISSTKNIQKTIIDCACFVADMWIEDIVPEDDELSLLDLPETIKVTFKNIDTSDDLSFIIAIDFRTKIQAVSTN